METRSLSLKAIKGNTRNPRVIKDSKFESLINSVLGFPKMLEIRPIVVDENLRVLGGNQRLKALRYIATLDAGHIQQRLFEIRSYRQRAAQDKATLVNYWAKWLEDPVVNVVDASSLTEDERKEFIVKDNTNAGEWNFAEFENADWAGCTLEEWGIKFEDEDEGDEFAPAQLKRGVSAADYENPEDDADETGDDEEGGEDVETAPTFTDAMYKDVLYDFDNDLEIPNLLKERQAGRLELPLSGWGSCSRNRTDVVTYHFYVDDYRFEHLFADPIKLLNSGCKAIVEPNCSLHDQTPIAFGLNQIYKKRYLARFCQEMGIDVYVDLNVAEKFRKYNRLGIPKGYNAFATRGLDGWMVSLENDYKEAQEISGLEHPNFIVYGGGEKVKEFCKTHGVLYVTDFINAKKLD